MEERIRRVRVLFRELGYKLREPERAEGSYSAGFENESGLQGGFFIDQESRFLELAYTFSFSPTMADYVKSRLEEMLKICYEYGCYINIQTNRDEIAFSVFDKLYYSGLSYYSLRDSLKDFQRCVQALTELLELDSGKKQG